jgi:hypothetical protein
MSALLWTIYSTSSLWPPTDSPMLTCYVTHDEYVTDMGFAGYFRWMMALAHMASNLNRSCAHERLGGGHAYVPSTLKLCHHYRKDVS